jgi:single-strand DNA-binding protein
MQQMTLVGHLGNDAEAKDLGNIQVINFSVAVTEKVKEEKVTTWYKVAYFTNNVGLLPWLLKGSLVGITGKPDIESYTANDGTHKSNLKCLAREIKLYSSTRERSASPAANQQPRPNPSPQSFSPQTNEEEQDDLPF